MADRPHALCPGCNELVPIVNEVYWPHYTTRIEQVPPLQVIVDLSPCEGSGLPMRACRVCGCTELDCSQCIAKTGTPCSWVEDDLCSACHVPGQHVRVLTQEDLALHTDGVTNLNDDAFHVGFENDGAGGVKMVEFCREILGEFVDKESSDADRRRR
jgi:hypothetical protein